MSHILPSLAAAWRSAATASSSAASSSSCRRCIRALQTGTSSSYSITRSRRSYASSTSSSSASPPTSVESPTLATNQPPSSPSQADLQKSATKTPRPKSKEKAPKAATKVEQQPPPTAEAHFRTEHELHAISSRTRRIVLSNPDTAKEIVQKMNLQTPDMVVMEIYCGSGLLSSELLKLPNVKQVIGVEDYPKFTKPLHDLVETSGGRFSITALDAFWWDSYRVAQEKGLMDTVQKREWSDETTNFAIAGVIPNNINGERLFLQQITHMASRVWLWKYGRFNMYYLLTRPFAERIMLQPGENERRKMAVMIQAFADIEILIPSKDLYPLSKHFQGLRTNISYDKKTEYVLLKIAPKKKRMVENLEDLEVLEFLTKNMFVQRAGRWVDTIKYLAPGAAILSQHIKDSGYDLPDWKLPKDFSNEDWLQLVKAFQNWSFRPETLEQDEVKIDKKGVWDET